MEKIKTNTVISKRRWSKARFPQGESKRVPFVYLSGLWLENLGFAIGQRLDIYSPEKGQLLLEGMPPGNRSGSRRSKNSKRSLRD
ncbi:MAG: type I addiction module toxin, SymE family [Candidatus Aminicenantes bacterium]|nr:type I addiction module toxin, SymE family [Candidatus Aminicenantes bacterium]NIM81756.1 type I addiction module toxin, SymE family [Candidatus Aminicenantes bacterium]NIN21128.1 type I addiction module toxin, SymE family [Candidatus Aminicenantes bacterium]NIN44950.1 type I addiction module toxin, SymE family [Candidatus Aminicenantes bacterium]NIN87764.1 type I addiction module toxin, SymE family [Candidatus Aminicenantes bacterium]